MKNYIIVSIVFVSIGILLRMSKRKSIKSIGNILIVIGTTLVINDFLSIFGIMPTDGK